MSAPEVDRPGAVTDEGTAPGFYERLTPWPVLPLAPAIRDARASLATAIADLLTVPDGALEGEWRLWDGDQELRYAFYRCYEVLEAAAAQAGAVLAAHGGTEATLPARAVIAPATAARWELHGVLAALTDEDLDRDPGGGEWTIRQTMGHMIEGQRAYAWFSAWWLAQRDVEDFPASVPEELDSMLPAAEVESAGSLSEVRATLDDALDATSERMGTLSADHLAQRARWSGHAITVGFRLARSTAHLREHTIQVDKTLAMLDRRPTEVERLVRLVSGGYGRLEERVFGVPEELLDRAGTDGQSVSTILRESLDTVAGHAADAAETARRSPATG